MSKAQRATYGGEAVFDGVMMRGMHAWSLAVRLPSGAIHVDVHPVPAWMKVSRKVPIIRGIFALVASVVLGIRSLQDSMAFRDDAQRKVSIKERVFSLSAALLIAAVFLVLPLLLAKLLFDVAEHPLAFSSIEALGRLAMLLAYLVLLGMAKDVRKVFAYHAAEHQTISAREAGVALTPQNIQAFSARHPRCGTAFLLLILVIGTLAHALVGSHSTAVLALSRVVLLPLVAGITYELLRISSSHLDTRWAKMLAFPGLSLQRLTTRPSSSDQIEVAIAALAAVVAADEQAEAAARLSTAGATA